MEDFFEQPLLEKLYDYLSEDFKKYVLSDKNELKIYNNIIYKKQNTIKEALNNNKNKKVMDKLQNCFLEETEYWNKKYFQLGITYMVGIYMPKDFTKFHNEYYSNKIHNFLDNVRLKNIDVKQKELLANFIYNLKKGTETQKRRFLMYYNLINTNNKILNYADIGEIEECSSTAIKASVSSITSKLVRLEESQKLLLLSIIKEIDI